MSVVVDVVRVESEGSDGKVKNFMRDVVTVCFVMKYKLSFKELWNVENDCQEDWREDVGEEVDLGGVAQLVTSVEKRLADCQVSFCGDAHDQEYLPAEEDVLHWVQKEREDDDVERISVICQEVNEDEAEKHDVTSSKSNQTLVEGGLKDGIFEDYYCKGVSGKPKNTEDRDCYIL